LGREAKKQQLEKRCRGARAGNLSVADHLAQMRIWLADRNIVPRELVMLHVLNLRLVFRADGDADLFAQTFGNHPAPPPLRPG